MTATTLTMQEAALGYVAQGFKVFPLIPRNKKPLTEHGLKDATQTQQGVREYWPKGSQNNIGLVCDGLLVCDFDGIVGLESLAKMEAEHGKLPRTRVVKTGGGTADDPHDQGLHYYYVVSTDLNIRPGSGKYGYPKFDIRANDSYVVAYPSVTRLPYELIDDLPAAPAPEWLIELAKTKKDVKTGKPEAQPISDINKGNRHVNLVSLIGKLRHDKLSEELIELLVQKANAEADEPLPPEEVTKIRKEYEHQADQHAGSELPQIVVNGRPLREVTTEAISAMQAANNPPRIFERGANPVRTNRNEQNRPFIELMSEAAMRGFMDRSADYMSVRQDNDGKLIYTHVHPPQDVVKDVMTVPQRRFPPLVAITPNPVMRANGTVLSTPGYDAESRLYYEPESGLKVPELPANPTKEELQAAINLFTEPLCDFPFENDASKANALAVLMCPVIRPMIDGCVPLALFDKPQSGTGASLLAEVIALVATGTPAAMMAAPGDNDEWRKVITTTILSGETILVIDNIEDTLQSAALSVLLTSRQWKGRILGRSEDILLPNILTPIGTGNNVRLGGDLPRRCVWVRMDAQTARPWMRKVVFKHPNLHEWIMQSRGAILAAILTIVRAWILAGSPQKADQDILGGYESYSRIMGGILNFIGTKGFLTNLASMYDIVDTNIPAWEAFLTVWNDILKDRAVTTAELITELNQKPEFKAALPDDYADMTIKNYQRRLGIAISSRKMARFPNGLKIQKAGTTDRYARWEVIDTTKMSLGGNEKMQDSYNSSLKMSLDESFSNQTHEEKNNTQNIIYGVTAVQDNWIM
jgi:hypothetical protein